MPAATAAAAFFLPAAAAPAASAGVLAAGGTAAGLGGAAVAGSTVALVALLEKRTQEARELIEEDERAFKMYLSHWFVHTQGLVDAIEELMRFDVIEGFMEDLNEVFSWAHQDKSSMLLNSKGLFVTGLKLCLSRLLPSLGPFLAGFGAAFLASLITFLFSLLWLKRRSLFRLVSRTWSMRDRLRSLDLSSFLEAVCGAKAQVFLFACWHGRDAFAALGLMGSVAAVVLASLDLKRGRCEGADAVEKVSVKLKEELEILEDVYRNLVS